MTKLAKMITFSIFIFKNLIKRTQMIKAKKLTLSYCSILNKFVN